MHCKFDEKKNKFFNSKNVRNNIEFLIEIGFNANDIFIISEIMFTNNIRKFDQFFVKKKVKSFKSTTKVIIPHSKHYVNIYHARIGEKVLSPSAEMFFRFIYGYYHFQKLDSRHIDALYFNKSLNDINLFNQMISKSKKNLICRNVFKKCFMF